MRKGRVISTNCYTQVEVLRNQTLLHCVIAFDVAQNFHCDQDLSTLRRHVRHLCIYTCILAPSWVHPQQKFCTTNMVNTQQILLRTTSWAYFAEIRILVQAGQPYSLIPRLSCMGKSLGTRLGSCSCCLCSPFLLWSNCTWIIVCYCTWFHDVNLLVVSPIHNARVSPQYLMLPLLSRLDLTALIFSLLMSSGRYGSM